MEREKKACRFCGRVVAFRNVLGSREYKAVMAPHKCPHGNDCACGDKVSKGWNWPAMFIGNPPMLAKGCPECYRIKIDQYNTDRKARINN